jgi:hypothetical protein
MKRSEQIGAFRSKALLWQSNLVGCWTSWLTPNPTKYPRQRVLVVACDNYAHLVPFVEEEDYFFLKTVIPSRKAARDYLNQGETDAEN